MQTAPARTAAADAPPSATDRGIFSTTLNSKLYQLQLDIERTTGSNYEVHLYAYTPVGAPLTVQQWKVTAALPAKGIEPIDVPTLRINDTHASGSVTLPSPGTWQFNFTLRISDFDEATVSTAVPVT